MGSASNQVGDAARAKRYGPFFVCPSSDAKDFRTCIVATGVHIRAGARVDVCARGRINVGGGVPVGVAVGVPVGPRIGEPVVDASGDAGQAGSGYPAPALRKNSLLVQVAFPLPKGSVPVMGGVGPAEPKSGKFYQGGTQQQFVAAEDGELILMPNDNKMDDNRGVCNAGADGCGWEVVLYVTGESALGAPVPGSSYPSLPKPPGALTPEQQQALDDCVKKKLASTSSAWGPAAVTQRYNATVECRKKLGLPQ